MIEITKIDQKMIPLDIQEGQVPTGLMPSFSAITNWRAMLFLGVALTIRELLVKPVSSCRINGLMKRRKTKFLKLQIRNTG